MVELEDQFPLEISLWVLYSALALIYSPALGN